VQALIVVPIVESRIVLLATHIQRAQWGAQQVILLKFDLLVPKREKKKGKKH